VRALWSRLLITNPHMNTQNRPRQRHAFTLLELLTVIAIIGILAAILIPVVGAVRASARSAACVSNLRQWHTAWVVWANDNDDRVIPGNLNVDLQGRPAANIHWPGPLGQIAGYNFNHPYVFLSGRDDTIGTCPGATIEDSPGAHWRNNQNNTQRHISYGYNHLGLGSYFSGNRWEGGRPFPGGQPAGANSLRLHQVGPRTIVFGDSTNWHLGTRGGQTPNADVSFRHKGRANFVLSSGGVISNASPPEDNYWYFEN